MDGLGKLSNHVSQTRLEPLMAHPKSSLPIYNLEHTWDTVGLTRIEEKWMNIQEIGSGTDTIIFVHGLGASLEYYRPLIQTAGLDSRYRIILYDLEGHGLTPTAASSKVTVETYVEDLRNLFYAKKIANATVVGWSLGGLIAMLFAEKNRTLVHKLVLLGPGPNPFPEPAVKVFTDRAKLVRADGMEASGVAQAVSVAATSLQTQNQSPVLTSSVRQSLLATHPEGYAKGCMALAKSTSININMKTLDMPVLLVAGSDDKISSVALAEGYMKRLPSARLEVIEGVGHWHVTEDVEAVTEAIRSFL